MLTKLLVTHIYSSCLNVEKRTMYLPCEQAALGGKPWVCDHLSLNTRHTEV